MGMYNEVRYVFGFDSWDFMDVDISIFAKKLKFDEMIEPNREEIEND